MQQDIVLGTLLFYDGRQIPEPSLTSVSSLVEGVS